MSFTANNCCIPDTHQRLRQAHILWHQTANNYADVDLFLTNLNSLIQELRNITFILQSEKSAFPDFDSWYSPWQERLKKHEHGRWLIDTRNAVVKQGNLATSSHFNVKFLNYYEMEVVTLLTETQADLSISAVLRRGDFVQVIAYLRHSMLERDQGDAVIALERCWSTAELQGAEILGVLGSLYGCLANLVQDAHVHLGSFDCVSTDESSRETDFPSHRLNSDILPCMMRAQAARTDYFTLLKFEPISLGSISTQSTACTASDIEARYNVKIDEHLKPFDSDSPLKLFDQMVWSSKRMLRKDKELARIMMLRDANGLWSGHMIIARNRVEKYLLMHLIAEVVREKGCDALIEVGETWIVDKVKKFTDLDRLHSSPGRRTQSEMNAREAISVRVDTRDGLSQDATTPFERGPFGGIRLADTVDGKMQRPIYLDPIYRVWAQQRRAIAPRGRGWLPEYGEPCVCGNMLTYAECCASLLYGAGAELLEPDDLLEKGQLDLAEKHARATITRYVSWIRQHTVMSFNSADRKYAKKMIPIDCLALQAVVAKLERWARQSDEVESVLNTYRRLQDVVGIPEITRRLVALCADWLLSNGREEEGFIELARLGKPEEITDAHALVISATFDDHEPIERLNLLDRAASFALDDEERARVLLLLAEQAIRSADIDKAVQAIDQVLATSKREGTVRAARTLKWKATRADVDLELLVALIKNEKADKMLIAGAAFLMDHDQPRHALNVLEPLLASGNEIAQIFAAECEVKSKDCEAATARLQSLHLIDESSPGLRRALAHVQALLVIGCERYSFRDTALSLLETLAKEEHVDTDADLIEALKTIPTELERSKLT